MCIIRLTTKKSIINRSNVVAYMPLITFRNFGLYRIYIDREA